MLMYAPDSVFWWYRKVLFRGSCSFLYYKPLLLYFTFSVVRRHGIPLFQKVNFNTFDPIRNIVGCVFAQGVTIASM